PPTADREPQFLLAAGEPALERAQHAGGDPRGVPVHPEHAPQRLEPERMREAAQDPVRPLLQQQRLDDDRAEASHALRQPGGDAAGRTESRRAAPCHFVGLSMGGFIGMRLALRRPELLRSLALLETAADPEPALNKPKYALMGLITRALGTRPLLAPIMKIMF